MLLRELPGQVGFPGRAAPAVTEPAAHQALQGATGHRELHRLSD
jgi:hypothetical protein